MESILYQPYKMKCNYKQQESSLRLSILRDFMQFIEAAYIEGYKATFQLNVAGILIYDDLCFLPEEVTIHRIYNFEGEQENDDYVTLYFLEILGIKGTFVKIETQIKGDYKYASIDRIEYLNEI